MSNGIQKSPSKTQKAGEALGGIGLGGGLAMLAARYWPTLTPDEVIWLAAALTALVTSGASFLRRVAHAYDVKLLKVLLGIALVVPLMGCQTPKIGPEGIEGGGDSEQDVLSISGPGSVTFDPETGMWTAECEAEQPCSLTWATQSAANAERDAKIAEIIKDGILGGIAMGLEAAAPVP